MRMLLAVCIHPPSVSHQTAVSSTLYLYGRCKYLQRLKFSLGTHSLSHSLSLSHTLSLTHTHTHSLSLSHTHTLSLSLSHTHTLSRSLSRSVAGGARRTQSIVISRKAILLQNRQTWANGSTNGHRKNIDGPCVRTLMIYSPNFVSLHKRLVFSPEAGPFRHGPHRGCVAPPSFVFPSR